MKNSSTFYLWLVACMISGIVVAQSTRNKAKYIEPELPFSDVSKRLPNGKGQIKIEGELKQWHKVTLTLDGPFAHELDNAPNPFTDYRMMVRFQHESGTPAYNVPAYFAADGNAGETGADNGTKWRAHLSPDKTGKWTYTVSFLKEKDIAVSDGQKGEALKPYDGKKGSFIIVATDKKGADLRSKGRLEYVGKHHLQFKGNKQYFLKVGSDAPETLLAFEDFDATYTMKVPLKKYAPHLNDFKSGDPNWRNGKGKGLIGAINYLSGKGLNAFSFLTYNAAGDGDNVWPFVKRDEKLHYDCSKLDQWDIVFDHAQRKGMFLHFKTQETENDDNIVGNNTVILPAALDGGDLGKERKLYYRELIARFAYLLALNWNLGEENTQSEKQRKDMAAYFRDNDPYRHSIVLHTFPDQQDLVYTPLLGNNSALTGLSLQNDWNKAHERTLRWLKASEKAGVRWVVSNDEQGSAGQGVPPDPGYKGYDAQKIGYDLHDVRKQTLWGNLMAGGAGVEYYFGYSLPENDLVLEDFRSRDQSWNYCRIAISFFRDNPIPFWEMTNQNKLIQNEEGSKEKYCLAKDGETYLVYLAYVSTSSLDLTNARGNFKVQWFNPRKGGVLQMGSVQQLKAGNVVALGNPPEEHDQDWLVIIQKI